jgi:hypothetical protein
MLVVGLSAGASVLAAASPPAPELSGAAAFAPVLAAPLEGTASYLLITTALLALAASYERFRRRQALKTVVWAAVIGVAIVAVPNGLRDSATMWALGAVAAGVVILGALRLCSAQPSLVPGIVGTVLAAEAVDAALAGAYPGATVGGLLTAVLVGALASGWSRLLASTRAA